MPRKSEITKEMIVNAGYEIVRTMRHEKLSARNIAKHLNCSTQPIYYYFQNIDEVADEVGKMAYSTMINEYFKKNSGEDAFLQMGLGYIEFAAKERNLFEFLYFSNKIKGMEQDDQSDLIDTMQKGEKMDDIENQILERIHKKIDIFVHGLAVRLMNKSEEYSHDEVRTLIIEAAQAITYWERNKRQ